MWRAGKSKCIISLNFNFNFSLNSCLNKSTSPVECNPGTYSSTGATKCNNCIKGFKCPNSTIQSPIKCLSGTYSNETKSTECRECPAGFSCPNVDESPVECVDGYYSTGSRSQCVICPHGHRYLNDLNYNDMC